VLRAPELIQQQLLRSRLPFSFSSFSVSKSISIDSYILSFPKIGSDSARDVDDGATCAEIAISPILCLWLSLPFDPFLLFCQPLSLLYPCFCRLSRRFLCRLLRIFGEVGVILFLFFRFGSFPLDSPFLCCFLSPDLNRMSRISEDAFPFFFSFL